MKRRIMLVLGSTVLLALAGCNRQQEAPVPRQGASVAAFPAAPHPARTADGAGPLASAAPVGTAR